MDRRHASHPTCNDGGHIAGSSDTVSYVTMGTYLNSIHKSTSHDGTHAPPPLSPNVTYLPGHHHSFKTPREPSKRPLTSPPATGIDTPTTRLVRCVRALHYFSNSAVSLPVHASYKSQLARSRHAPEYRNTSELLQQLGTDPPETGTTHQLGSSEPLPLPLVLRKPVGSQASTFSDGLPCLPLAALLVFAVSSNKGLHSNTRHSTRR